ncbi:181_t:CDS:1, partial [Dentiscutata heterogama]
MALSPGLKNLVLSPGLKDLVLSPRLKGLVYKSKSRTLEDMINVLSISGKYLYNITNRKQT